LPNIPPKQAHAKIQSQENQMKSFLTLSLIVAGLLAASIFATIQAQASENEPALWNLEHDYFRYVEANDLKGYLTLWHKNFLGWPSVSATPVHKDHITDWITNQTSKGISFKLIEFKPASLQVTGDIAVSCYWITYKWIAKDGGGPTQVTRITHTWIKDDKDWRIIGGMSMPESK
jgi:ketosteroid isomerase-like protein